jgi:3-dehydroquinate synthase
MSTGGTAAFKTLNVALGERSYPILIGPGLLERTELLDEHIPGRDVLLVSNTTVGPLYSGIVARGLASRRVVEVTLPDGEQHKTLAMMGRMIDALVANHFGRDCTVVALGGGVVGDLSGFAAASYQRGVRYVQIPTTLLAQVDSSVGGKTGVNHAGGKNLIGAFHQPSAVIADTATLETLPTRELSAGIAEVIKYGLIRDAEFFAWLEANMDRLLGRDSDALAYAIGRSCEIKAEFVGHDEREHGERALLNLGHTFGHAIETATQYTGWLHGEAVAAGLMIAAAMSRECGLMRPGEVERLHALLQRAGLPVGAPGLGPQVLLEHMKIDKKVQGGRIRLVLLRRIGDSYLTADYPDAALRTTLESYCG